GRPLLTGGTGRLASAHFAFRELPARRHRRRRLRVLELAGPRDFDERTRALRERRGRFVGRTGELERLEQAYEIAVAEGRRVVAAVIGGAGAGKSRLLAEFVARAEARPPAPRLVALAANPAARDAPFWLVGDLLQSTLTLPPRRGRAARGATVQRLRHVLGGVGLDRSELDECLAAVELALELRDGAVGSGDPAAADLRERVASALRSLRRALTGPVLVVIEDLHLAHATSSAVLRSGVQSEPAPELVVLTSRRELRDLPEDALRIALDELDEEERAALIRDRLAGAGDESTVAAVARRAGGNPLFIEELAGAVRERAGGATAVEVPAGVRDVLTARVDRLAPACRATLQHAAVIGPVFRSRILEELLGPAVHD